MKNLRHHKCHLYTFVRLLLWAVVGSVAIPAQAGYETAFRFTSASYSAAEGGTISGTLERYAVFTSCTASCDWNVAAAKNATITLAPSGTYQISAGDLPSNWQDGLETVTFGAFETTVNFSIPFVQNTSLQYDRTATLSVNGLVDNTAIQDATVTLLDDDNPIYAVIYYNGQNYCDDLEIVEGGTSGANTATLRILRGSSAVQARTINYSISTSTATAGTDYTASPALTGSVTIPQGSDHTDFTITALPDAVVEGSETVTLQINGGIYTVDAGCGSRTVTILDDTPRVRVYATSSAIAEGGSTLLVFERTNAYVASAACTNTYAISGTASNGVDYVPALSGTAIIPAGSLYTTVTLAATNDTLLEGAEAATVTLNSGLYSIISGYEAATVTIHDDYPVISIEAEDTYALESGETGTFVITRTGNYSKAVTVQLSISGTATPGTDYTALPTSITFAAGAWTTNLVVTPLVNSGVEAAETVVVGLQTNAAYILGLHTNAVVTIGSEEANPRDNYTKGERYIRGTGTNEMLHSMVIPLDGIKGTRRDDMEFLGYTTAYHYNATNPASQAYATNRLPYNTPIASFGGDWGTPLYFEQSYSFGLFVGEPTPDPIVIYAFRRSDGGLEGTTTLQSPNLSVPNDWINFSTNGFVRTTNGYGLTTTWRIAKEMNWGTPVRSYMLTHTADNSATNYTFLITAGGTFNGFSHSLTAANQPAYGYFYELTFQSRPSWRSVFVDQPHFQGEPLPPHLWNKTPEELFNYGATVTNAVSLTPSACTNLDHSPELRRHPTLDQFVADLNNDPIALANYVQNEIDLTDPIAYRDDGSVATESVNPGGVNRGALGVYLEGQGSPVEQCALLVYLLRQAGYPATYVFPPEGGMKMLDTRLSALMRMRINRAQDDAGRYYTTNKLITVNYPWVAAYVGNQWVHLFPWIKDTSVEEGLNVYDYLPAPYKQMQLWVKDYIYGKTNITAFATPTDDTPGTIFPRWLDDALKQNAPGISVDDLGMRYINRRHFYSQWSDFPRPTWTTNTSSAVESLMATSITNISPRLTNIFDTVQVELYSVSNPQKKMVTPELRTVDLHNRRFYLSHTNVSAGVVQAILSLGAYRPDATGQGSFSASDTTLTNRQKLTLSFDSTDDELKLRLRYRRQKALSWETALDARRSFLDLGMTREVLEERLLRKGEIAAICINAGRVTPAMLRVHAQELWNMEQMLGTNSAAISQVSPDVYHGSLLYLAGMSYYERVGRNNSQFQDLFKVRTLSHFAMGLSKLSPRRNPDGSLYSGTLDPIWPNVDMFFNEVGIAGNETVRLDSGWDGQIAKRDYFLLSTSDISAQEHATLNTFFGQSNSVSTVKLLQQAQSKVTTGGSNIVELSIYSVVGAADVLYNGTALRYHDPEIWSQVLGEFLKPSPQFVVAWMTPGTQTTPSGSFSGMAAFFAGNDSYGALIGNNQYGGYADALPYGSASAGNTPWYEIRADADGNYNASFSSPTANQRRPGNEVTTVFDLVADYAQYNDLSYVANPNQSLQSILTGLVLSGAPSSYAISYANLVDSGLVGTKTDYRDGNGTIAHVADPVNALTGEFYVDEVDLSLPGPMPLQLRRNYGSQNLAPNQLGFGWKLNYMPYLSVAASNVIYAAEADGSVIAFDSVSTNLWMPTLALNPTLNNHTANGIGSVANQLNAKLTKVASNYFLTNGDGSLRVFQEMSFPLTNSTAWDRSRPYLTYWYDNRSNFYRFEYGTNSVAADYGQVRRIVSSSGTVLRFEYDPYGRITDVYSLDGRRVQYDYDKHGDLVTVTRPDTSELNYEYQLLTWSTNSVTNVYSTHLLTKELKPDGRVLKNEYDEQRRVTNQWATVGPDLRLVRNATFRFTNNFTLTNLTATLSGTTTVLDYTNNPTTYFYTNGLIRRVRDPLSAELVQEWYEASETNAPAYPRSLKTITDKRGLVTTFLYDDRGNVTNTTTRGDLLGDGNTNTTTTSLAFYNADNLPVKTIGASGETNLFFYTNTWLLARVELWPSNATPAQAVTNLYTYASATNAADGTVAYGLRVQEIRAAYSPDATTNEWAYSSRGFPTRQVRYTGTSDPALIVTNLFNYRGELAQQTDAAGRSTRFGFDPLGRPQSREVFETGGPTPVAWDFSYYNENGELTWTDGPRFNPEDYVWHDHDGAGRPTQQVRWRSRGKADGTGVEAESGDNQYATTFSDYDAFNNLIKTTDPLGNYSRKKYDVIGQLIREEFYDANNTLLATNGFRYNLAGDVTNAFNALGGSVETQFTSTGSPKFRRSADGSTNAWRYYKDGRVQRAIQQNGAYWETVYDDANRKTTRTFFSSSGTPLATNITELDRRGNPIKYTDAAGYVFTTIYDGLNRVKVSAGPPVITVKQDCPFIPNCGNWVTNVLQQATTNFYDAAGVWFTNVNALGEKTISRFDALGRNTRTEIRAANGTLVRETSTTYSADHHGVTVTNGSGASAIVSTAFTDTDGQSVLAVSYPYANVREYTRNEFNRAGNLTYSSRFAATNSATPVFFSGMFQEFDGLNRIKARWERDDALTTFAYNPAGLATNRTMPGGLQWNASYNNAGQMLQEWNTGAGGANTRSNTYVYFGSGSPLAGLLATNVDGRGVVCVSAYDEWLRPVTNSYFGSFPDNRRFVWQYDVRGLTTNMMEVHGTSSVADRIQRKYDAYGQLVNENGANQFWDAAGRRTKLDFAGFSYGFSWRADGSLIAVSTPVGGGTYSYSTAGLLTNRTVGNRTTSLNSFDGMGRPLAITTKVSLLTKLAETLSWSGDALLTAHSLVREDFTDARQYSYADFTRRLTEERINLDAFTRWTNSFAFDNGQFSGPGALTKQGLASAQSNSWSAGLDAFSRVSTETNTMLHHLAHGLVNGDSSVKAWLDDQPMALTLDAIGLIATGKKWHSMLVLSPGVHKFEVAAAHPSGVFTTNAISWFTNTTAYERVSDSFDGGGYLNQRLWLNPDGTTNRIQNFRWSARGELIRVEEVDANTNGNFIFIGYDCLGRRKAVISWPVANGIYKPQVLNNTLHTYDPEGEFLELGVNINGKLNWKMYGPDLNGGYGSLNGVGGLDATVSDLMVFSPTISDARGNILGAVDNGSVTWNSSRPAGYGSPPGYRPLPMAHGGSVAAAHAWRGRAVDVTGLVWLGARYYDPETGSFLSSDPVWNGRDPNYYSFCGGDPINFFDADGRYGKEVNGWLNPFSPEGIAHRAMLSGLPIPSSFDTFKNRMDGVNASAGYWTEYNRLNQKTFSQRAGHFAADAVLNQDARADAWRELSNPDFSSGWGVATFAVAGVSYGANTIDAAANAIPLIGTVKGLATTGVKTGIKAVAGIFAKDTAKELVGIESKQLGEILVKETASTTRLGVTRNNPADWRATRDLWDNTGYSEILSEANRSAIAKGRTPVVDEDWIKHFPEDAGLFGEKIPMHHIQGTPVSVPLPATRHMDAHMPGGYRYNPGGPGSAVPSYPPKTAN